KAVDAEMATEKRDYAERRQAGEKDLDQLHRQSTECTEKLTIAANMRNNRKNVERALSEAAAQRKWLRTGSLCVWCGVRACVRACVCACAVLCLLTLRYLTKHSKGSVRRAKGGEGR